MEKLNSNSAEELFTIEDNVLKSTIDVSGFYRLSLADEIIKALEKSADKVIMIDSVNDISLTGHQVLTEVLKLASSLIGQGLTKGDVVAFYTDFKNLTLNAIGFMATIVAGLIYTARDNQYPYEELLRFCKRSNVTVLVTSESTLNLALRVCAELPQIKHTFILDKPNSSSNSSSITPRLFDLPSAQDEDVHLPCVDTEKDIAVIAFSSGSTGVPKAVSFSPRNILCFATIGLKPFNIASRPGDIVLIGAPMYHIVDIELFFSTLYYGNQMVLYPVSEHWLVYAAKYRATTVVGFPPDMNYFVKHFELHAIECVTDVLITGSNIDPKTCEQFIKNYNVQQIRNFYGSTETGAISVALNGKVSVNCSGTILPGCQVKVVNRKNGNLCGPNEVGVIFAKTPMAASGYLNDEQANQAAFNDDGFYDTGDAGYFDNNGCIYITDRYKETFDCDGEAVSPTEIEQVLMTHEAVAEVAVFGKDDDIYGKVAKAFVVLKPDQSTSEPDLIQFVSERLVYYKHLFGGVELKSKFPRTTRGKIDRKLLKNQM